MALSVLPFQNCGQGFKTSEELSTLCTAKIQTAAKAIKIQNLVCDVAADYSCERRVFSPIEESSERAAAECFGDDFCISVVTRTFNTSAARSAADMTEFLPGGEYNRTEVNCVHNYREASRNVAVFTGEGSKLEDALASARHACEGSR